MTNEVKLKCHVLKFGTLPRPTSLSPLRVLSTIPTMSSSLADTRVPVDFPSLREVCWWSWKFSLEISECLGLSRAMVQCVVGRFTATRLFPP